LKSGLPDPHAIKEPLDQNQPLIPGKLLSPMEIKEHQGLTKPWRQFVPFLTLGGIPRPPADVGHELAGVVMDRDRDAPRHHALLAAAKSEHLDRLFGQPTAQKIRMIRIQIPQGKLERGVHNRWFRLSGTLFLFLLSQLVFARRLLH